MMTFVQRTIAGVVAVIGISALLVIARFPIWWVLLSALVVWWICATLAWRVLYLWNRIVKDVVFLMPTMMLASTGMYLVVEWPVLRWFILGVVILMTAVLYGWEIDSEAFTTHIEKAYRRIFTMFWVYSVYGLQTALFAFYIFFQEIPFWAVAVVQGIISGIITRQIWHLYYRIEQKRSWFFALLVMLIVTELSWVVHALPLGYTALGLLVTWMWYIVQLLFRFELSEQGIIWERQRFFLIMNAIALFIILTLVRWI